MHTPALRHALSHTRLVKCTVMSQVSCLFLDELEQSSYRNHRMQRSGEGGGGVKDTAYLVVALVDNHTNTAPTSPAWNGKE